MVAKNEITGDKLQTGIPTDEYRNNYSNIFGLSPLDRRIWREYFEENHPKGVDIPKDNPEVDELYTIWLKEKEESIGDKT
jgi:hypothetical protein